jgi:Recombination endonuclease VII
VTTPVRYGEHIRPRPGTHCLPCGEPALKMVADHCHVHGWVRGPACPRCNTFMAFIDRRISPRGLAPLALSALVAHAARCPDCEPFGVENLEPTRPIGPEVRDGKVSAFVRIPLSLKKRWAASARARGLTLNASAIIVLDQAFPETDESARD